MITDETFKAELDELLHKRKILKAARNNIISNYLKIDGLDRDDVLELEMQETRNYIEAKRLEKHIPLESVEQKAFVAWFREAYPAHIIMMVRNDGYRTASEKAEQLLLGLHKGAADLYIPHLHTWVEMKRIKGSVWPLHQKEFKAQVEGYGDRYILGLGFEDAREQLLNKVIE